MEEQLARVRLVPARPLDAAERLQARVGHAAVDRGDGADLVPRPLRGRLAPVVPHAPRDLVDDPEVLARLARRVERLADPLDAPLGVRDRALGLRPGRGGGQDDVRDLRGRGQDDVLDDEEVEAPEPALGQVAVGLGLERVLADHVERRSARRGPSPRASPRGASRASPGCRSPRPSRSAGGAGRSRRTGSPAADRGGRPCRRRPGRCSGRAAGSGRSRTCRRGRSGARG